MSRPKRISLDPSWLEAGTFGRLTGQRDTYFGTEGPELLTLVLDHFVSRLPEPDRSCVLACIMGKYAFSEAAVLLADELGYEPDKKTVWRWAQRGLKQVKHELAATPWAAAMLADRLPLDEDEVLMPSQTGPLQLQLGVIQPEMIL